MGCIQSICTDSDFSLPQLHFKGKGSFPRPSDTVTLQHDGGPGALLLCHQSQAPSHQTGYVTLNSTAWVLGLPAHYAAGSWRNGTTCALRVLYAVEETVPIISRKNFGVDHSDLYTVRATVDNGVFSTNLTCNFWVVSPVLGLRVIYPPQQGSIIYLETNSTWLVLKISSGMKATAGWLGGNQSFPFERSCPSEVTPLVAECARETNDTWFSVVMLEGIGRNVSTLVLWAENAVSSQNITVLVKAEEAIRGLRATPEPETRVLLNNRVVSLLEMCPEPHMLRPMVFRSSGAMTHLVPPDGSCHATLLQGLEGLFWASALYSLPAGLRH